MKRFSFVAMSVLAIISLAGCGGDTSATQADTSTASPAAEITPLSKQQVEVPDTVKGKWSGVVLTVEDKDKSDTKEYTVKIGSTFKIPGSDLNVEIKDFLPFFVMQGPTVTSISNETGNPAALATVTEGGSEIFSGWLFQKYPKTHAFTHPRFSIILKEGVPA